MPARAGERGNLNTLHSFRFEVKRSEGQPCLWQNRMTTEGKARIDGFLAFPTGRELAENTPLDNLQKKVKIPAVIVDCLGMVRYH